MDLLNSGLVQLGACGLFITYLVFLVKSRDERIEFLEKENATLYERRIGEAVKTVTEAGKFAEAQLALVGSVDEISKQITRIETTYRVRRAK